MTEAISALQNLLESLFEIQRSAWFAEEGKWRASPEALETYKRIAANWEAMYLKDVKHKFNNSELDLHFCNRVLYLPPLIRDPNFVPVLSLSCKLNETQSIARFRVMLICLDENEKFRGIGFRLETPEGQNQAEQDEQTPTNEGSHDFHHAQLIRRLGRTKLDKLPIECPCWLPQSQPSFPLPAKCPVTLLLCLIVTLYGRRCYNRFFDTYVNNFRKSAVKRYKDKLDPWINCTSIQQASAQISPRNR